jgi:hypothetical protein
MPYVAVSDNCGQLVRWPAETLLGAAVTLKLWTAELSAANSMQTVSGTAVHAEKSCKSWKLATNQCALDLMLGRSARYHVKSESQMRLL